MLWGPQGGSSHPIGDVREAGREKNTYSDYAVLLGSSDKGGKEKAIVSREVSTEESVIQINPGPHATKALFKVPFAATQSSS